jgi:tetratricopeptide (TPR) repeat protein
MAPSIFRASSVVRTTSKPLRVKLAALACAGAALALPASVQAQQEVVQRLPSAEERALTEALQILARSPENRRALLTAGRSALALGDTDAALGFFSRVRDLDPGSGDALAGLAAVQVQRNEPVLAISLFDNAGEDALRDLAIVAERGLAYDLVGDQARAQEIYRGALAVTRSEELVRRLSLSQAISGNREASEATLLPLLQRQNKAAWRTRAFALAILGASDEAVTVANAVMPAGLAREMEPFLRIMPRLTPAQQAAAANLGKFPPSGRIGRDSDEVAAYVRGPQTAPQGRREAGQGLVPQGQPFGRADDDAQARRSEPAPAPATRTTDPVVVAPAPSAAEPAPITLPTETQSAAADPTPPPGFAPGFDLSQVPSTVQEEPAAEPDIASAFGDFARPTVDTQATEGGVDVTGIRPARPEPEDPPPPANPARIWVQLGIGRDVDALAFDWRRLQRRHDQLEGRDAYRARLGQTNRMVTGPFASREEALQLVNALKDDGHESLVWRSEEGEELTLLPDR